jgi:hypothetical protein
MLANYIKFAELKCLFEKKKPKTPISGRLAWVPAGSSALPTPNFRLIRRDLSLDLPLGAPTAGDALMQQAVAVCNGAIAYHMHASMFLFLRSIGEQRSLIFLCDGWVDSYQRSATEGVCAYACNVPV